MSIRSIFQLAILVAVLTVCGLYLSGCKKQAPPTSDLTSVSFATDWKAQAEQGGFYQAQALGLYEKRGLKVTIRQGGPGVNVAQLLGARAIDYGIGSNNVYPLNMVKAGVPAKAVMASFQKDPQVLITHPRDDIKTLADMKGHPIMLSDISGSGFWTWLRATYGFEDTQVRKYTFNLAPFLVNKSAIQQGYVTSEPYSIQTKSDIEPQVYLLSDYGYPGYAAFVLARNDRIEGNPDQVRAFVEASIEGWYSYLYGNPKPGNDLIKKANPEMTDRVLMQAIDKMKSHDIVDSGDSLTLGIGAMTDQRWRRFFELMSTNGAFDPGLGFNQAYTLEFINKGFGVDMKTASSPKP